MSDEQNTAEGESFESKESRETPEGEQRESGAERESASTSESPEPEQGEKSEDMRPGRLEPETRERIEEMMREMIARGDFGYKNKTGAEREVALQSEAMCEKLFAYLYADDPENAKKKWQTFSSKPADPGLINRAKEFQLENVNGSTITSLEDEQSKVLNTVNKFFTERANRNLQSQISNLQIALGDATSRKKDFMRRANSEIMAKEQDVDGLTIIKSFFRGATKVSSDYISAVRQKVKENEIKKSIKSMTLGAETSRINIIQDIQGGGFAPKDDGRSGPGSDKGGPSGPGFDPNGKGPKAGPMGPGGAGPKGGPTLSGPATDLGNGIMIGPKPQSTGPTGMGASVDMKAAPNGAQKFGNLREAVANFQASKQANMIAAIPGANKVRILMQVAGKVREIFDRKNNQKASPQQGYMQGMMTGLSR